MKLKRISSSIDRNERNNINENFDILERSYGKSAIDAQYAVETSNEAKQKVESVQTQFNQVVIEGDSSIEAAQARVDVEDIAHETLKVRIDNDVMKINQKIDGEIDVVTQRLEQTAETSKAAVKYAQPHNIWDYAYNIDVALRNFYNKLLTLYISDATTSKVLNVSVIGDSISEGNAAGTGASEFFEKGYLAQLKTKFAEKFGNAGRGYIPTYVATGAPKWTFTGTWTDNTGYFGTAGASKRSVTVGDSATLQFTGTGIGILFAKRPNNGKIGISVDGGAVTIVDTVSTVDEFAAKYELKGLPNSTHTLTITNASEVDGKPIFLFGAYEITHYSGVRFNMVGRSGTTVLATGTQYAIPAEIDIWEPDLTIIALTANDYGTQTPLTTYTERLQDLITAAKNYGDVLLVPIGTVVVPPTIETYKQQEYVDIQRQLAVSNNVAFFDIYTMWGGDTALAKTDLGFIKDNVHPNDAGHADIADKLYRLLTDKVNYNETYTKQITMVDRKINSIGNAAGNGLYNKIQSAFPHSGVGTSARDMIEFVIPTMLNNGDSSSIMGRIRFSVAGRNTGGANAYAVGEWHLYADNSGNVEVQQIYQYSPTISTTNVAIVLAVQNGKVTVALTPNKNDLQASCYVEIDYIQSYSRQPIVVKFSDALYI